MARPNPVLLTPIDLDSDVFVVHSAIFASANSDAFFLRGFSPRIHVMYEILGIPWMTSWLACNQVSFGFGPTQSLEPTAPKAGGRANQFPWKARRRPGERVGEKYL